MNKRNVGLPPEILSGIFEFDRNAPKRQGLAINIGVVHTHLHTHPGSSLRFHL